ncbi:hypothetical protein DSM112329_04202 [Paraconexibacter sp. AEG42_29]|uniref:Uncharacterized protein n=1 Tax=Paraconexibacter sp. AEG42_29 TaxID=2997339 RepID=A0AAU7B0D8_9ACTN
MLNPSIYGSCVYSVQGGQFGDASYMQLKLKSSGCLRYGYGSQCGTACPFDAGVVTQGYVAGGRWTSAYTKQPRDGVQVVQATLRPAIFSLRPASHLSVCRRLGDRRLCKSDTVVVG